MHGSNSRDQFIIRIIFCDIWQFGFPSSTCNKHCAKFNRNQLFIPFTIGGADDEPLLLAGGDGGGVVELLDCERFEHALLVFCRSNRSYRLEKNALQTRMHISFTYTSSLTYVDERVRRMLCCTVYVKIKHFRFNNRCATKSQRSSCSSKIIIQISTS